MNKNLKDIIIKYKEISNLFINGNKENVVIYKDIKPGDIIDDCAFFFLNLRIEEFGNSSILVFPVRDLYESIGNPLYTKDRILDLMNLGEFPYYYEDNELYFKVYYYTKFEPNKVIYIHFDDNGNMHNVELVDAW